MIVRKLKSLMKPQRNEMEYAVRPFHSQHVALVRPHLLSRQTRSGNVSAFFSVIKLPLKATVGVTCSLLFMEQFNLKSSTDPNFCRQHVQNLHVLVSLDLWDHWSSFLPGNLRFQGFFLFLDPHLPMVLHLHRSPSRHLQVALQVA